MATNHPLTVAHSDGIGPENYGPSGLLLGGVLMLVHIDRRDVAERVHNAWLRTMEDDVAAAARAARPQPKKDLVGVDVYVEWPAKTSNGLAAKIKSVSGNSLDLEMIANRGRSAGKSQ